MTKFLFGMITGAALMFTALHYHVVQSDAGFHLVPKTESTLADAYVDIRGFTTADWRRHKALAAAMVHGRRSDLITQQAAGDLRAELHATIDGLIDRLSS